MGWSPEFEPQREPRASRLYSREVLTDEINEDPPQDAIDVQTVLTINVYESKQPGVIGNAVVSAIADAFNRSRGSFDT